MVPKINVYLSDELAEAVKDAGLPVSAICQRALEQAVARITSIRETVISDGRQLRADLDTNGERFSRFTQRARTVLALAIDDATAAGSEVGTEHVLGGLLAEGGNLALAVLTSLHIEPQEIGRVLRSRRAGGTQGETTEPVFTEAAQEALRLTVSESTSLGHNYVGCEHLLLGLVTEPGGTAGQVLRELGAEPRLVRHAVSAALAGYTYVQANAAAKAKPAVPADAARMLSEAISAQLAPIVARLDRLEQHADPA